MVKCQCPACKESYEAEQEWIGQQAQCPYCQQTIIIQPMILKRNLSPETFQTPGWEASPADSHSRNEQKSTTSLVLGIISLIAWIIPLLGFPISIVGLIFGIYKKYTTGIILNVIGLSITLINSAIGAVLGAQGKLF